MGSLPGGSSSPTEVEGFGVFLSELTHLLRSLVFSPSCVKSQQGLPRSRGLPELGRLKLNERSMI